MQVEVGRGDGGGGGKQHMLQRYWSDQATPRPESYREDFESAGEACASNFLAHRLATELAPDSAHTLDLPPLAAVRILSPFRVIPVVPFSPVYPFSYVFLLRGLLQVACSCGGW